MKASGIDAVSDKTETDDYIEFRVKIPKNSTTECPLRIVNSNKA
jgi:hypothetical protein